jgi:hypothetical protein
VARAYLAALLLTVTLEVPTVAVCFPGERLRMGLACLLATSATHLLLFRLLGVQSSGPLSLVLGETFALLAEAAVYARVSRRRDPPRALVASALANGLSFGGSLVLGPVVLAVVG